MRTYIIQNCNDFSVTVPSAIGPLGFVPDSWYCMYFLDHAKDTPDANVLEVMLLPFDWHMLRNLYSITIKLRNVPHATAHAAWILAKHNVDIKTTVAVDSISGNIGSLEATIVSPVGLAELDQTFSRAYSKNENRTREFILENPFEDSGDDASGKHYGRFIIGKRFISNFEEFEKKIAECHPRVAGNPVQLNSINNRFFDIKIPTQIAKYMNKKYGRPTELSLKDYNAAITVDTEFNRLSISFMNPDEILCMIKMIIEDKVGLFNLITDYLGTRQVNFRIVYNKNINPGKKMSIEFLCDISKTELPLYNDRTIKRMILTDLRYLISKSKEEIGQIDDVDFIAQSGYPRNLSHFKPEDRFDLVDLYFVKKEERRSTIPRRLTLNHHTDGEQDSRSKDIACGIAEFCWSINFGDGDAETAIPIPDFEQAVESSFVLVGIPPSSLQIDRHPSSGFHSFSIRADRDHYWVQYRRDGVLVLHFRGIPPSNLMQRFFEEIGLGYGKLSNERFEDMTRRLLFELTYDFPTESDFHNFGSLDAEQFRIEARHRFNALSKSYLEEKWLVDKFPIEGNRQLANFLEEYLDYANGEITRKQRKIRVIDLGAAGGALTTLFAISVFSRLKIMKNIELVLVDISETALESTKTGKFQIPQELINNHFYPVINEHDYKSILADAEFVVQDLTSLPKEWQGKFDIVVSGFTHHHMNDRQRAAASRAMAELVCPGGFVGLVDESPTYEQYLTWRTIHVADTVKPAQESFLQNVDEHTQYFSEKGIEIIDKRKADWYYAFWGVRPSESRFLDAANTGLSGEHSGRNEHEITTRLENIESSIVEGFDATRVLIIRSENAIRQHIDSTQHELLDLTLNRFDQIDVEMHLLNDILSAFDILKSDLSDLIREENVNLYTFLKTTEEQLENEDVVKNQAKLVLQFLFVAFETNIDLNKIMKSVVDGIDRSTLSAFERVSKIYRSVKEKLQTGS